jgi:hypothetical protein
MTLLLRLALAALLGIAPAQAQNFKMPPPGGVVVIGAQVVASCGNQSLAVSPAILTVDTTGKLCTNAVVSATISGTISTSPVVVTPVSGVGTFITSCNAGCSGSGGGGSVTQGTVPWVIDSNTTSSNLYNAITSPIPAGTNAIGNLVSQYPGGSTPITASTSGTTGAFSATLTGVTSGYTFLCGFSIRDNATAATTSAANITGIVGGTVYYLVWTAPLASGLGVSEEIYNPCRPSSATSTNIVINVPAPGSGGLSTLDAWGYTKASSP